MEGPDVNQARMDTYDVLMVLGETYEKEGMKGGPTAVQQLMVAERLYRLARTEVNGTYRQPIAQRSFIRVRGVLDDMRLPA